MQSSTATSTFRLVYRAKCQCKQNFYLFTSKDNGIPTRCCWAF